MTLTADQAVPCQCCEGSGTMQEERAPDWWNGAMVTCALCAGTGFEPPLARDLDREAQAHVEGRRIGS